MKPEHKPWSFKIGPLSIHNKEQWDIELASMSLPQRNLIPKVCFHWNWRGHNRRLFLVY